MKHPYLTELLTGLGIISFNQGKYEQGERLYRYPLFIRQKERCKRRGRSALPVNSGSLRAPMEVCYQEKVLSKISSCPLTPIVVRSGDSCRTIERHKPSGDLLVLCKLLFTIQVKRL